MTTLQQGINAAHYLNEDSSHYMNRRIIILGGSIIIIGLLLAGGYFYFSLQRTASTSTPNSFNNFFSALFPFGQGTSQVKTPGGTTNTPEAAKVLTRLRKVSDRPTAGMWFAAQTSSTTPPHIRFMERATGHVFDTPADSYSEVRISNTTLPLIQDIQKITDTLFVVRTIPDSEHPQNFLAQLNATTSEQTVTTLQLGAFKRVAVGSETNVLTVSETGAGSEIQSLNPKDASTRALLLSPIRSWVPLAGGNRAFLETAPSSGALGFLYEVKAGALTKILGDVPGLLALPSPTGRYILYSSSLSGRTSLFLLDTKTGTLYPSPIGALALKCAWVSEEAPTVFCATSAGLQNATLPDDWLLGNVAFNDSAWLIRPLQGTAHSLGKLEEIAGTPIDVQSPTISPNGVYALFINKNDLSLWSLNLNQAE